MVPLKAIKFSMNIKRNHLYSSHLKIKIVLSHYYLFLCKLQSVIKLNHLLLLLSIYLSIYCYLLSVYFYLLLFVKINYQYAFDHDSYLVQYVAKLPGDYRVLEQRQPQHAGPERLRALLVKRAQDGALHSLRATVQ
jgi:hypothetical protein